MEDIQGFQDFYVKINEKGIMDRGLDFKKNRNLKEDDVVWIVL
jgi:hypothetical protein